MQLKRYISITMVLLCLFEVCAGVTAHYDLQATSFTNEVLVKQRIGLPESAEYESVEAMKERDLAYKQALDNMRIFKSVDIVYTESADQPDSFYVLFDIKSAITFVALPYPKYDSNTGFTLKLKLLDTNFLGNFGNLNFDAIINQNTEGDDSKAFSFGDSYFDIDGTLASLIGSLYVTASVDSNIYLSNWAIDEANSDLDAGISISGIRLGKLSMSDSLSGSLNFADIKNSSLAFSTSLSGFNFGPVGMSLSALARTTKIGLDNMEFGLSSGFSGLKLEDNPISLNPYVYGSVIDSTTKEIGLSRAGFSSGMSVGRHYFSSSFASYWRDDLFDERDTDIPYWQASASGSYSLASWVTPSASISVVKYIDSPWSKNNSSYTNFIYSTTVSEGLSFRFGRVPVSIGQSNTVYFDSETISRDVSFSTSYSSGAINYVRDDFRLGYRFSVSAAGQYYFGTDWKTNIDNDIRGHLEFTWFPIATEHFNPNIRIIATASDKPLGKIYSYDYDGCGLFYGSTAYLGDYLRGIRTYDKKSMAIVDYDAAALINVNLTLRSEDLGSLMRFYFNPFIDGAVLYDFEKHEPKYFGGAGLELITVLSSYPSYPLRCSVGFDLINLKKKIGNAIYGLDETIDGSFFEIYIGLHHFF